MATALIVCPLRFERRALLRAGVPAKHVECCGPGRPGVERWAVSAQPAGPVILCGVAGALTERCRPGTAWLAGAVLTGDARRIEPAVRDPGGPTLVSSEATIVAPGDRAEWAARTGADLVDLESAAFAELASARGWTWGIVRGVSDGVGATLPDGIDAWTDDQGRTRAGQVLRAILVGRASPALLWRLGRDGTAAMRAAAVRVQAMLGEADG